MSGTRAVLLAGQIQHVDFLADFLENSHSGFLPQGLGVNQRLQEFGYGEVRMPGIGGQGVGHGLDGQAHGVEADHVAGAVGR